MNLIQSNTKTMSSDELLNKINELRVLEGQSPVRRNDFNSRIIDEVDEFIAYETFVSHGQESKIYQLTEDQCLLVGMRESKGVRKSVLNWIRSLESNKPALPQTYAAALLEAGRLAQALEETSAKLIEAQPKVEFVDKYVASTGNKGFRQVAKLLGVKEPWFREFLTDRSIMYKLGGEWTARQTHIEAGRFIVKTGTSDTEHAYNTAKFTPKGVEWIAGLIAKSKANELMGINQ